MNLPDRPPFDAIDAEAAAAYLRDRDLTLVDPFADAQATDDVIFTTALSGARFLMARSFGIARADGTTFRAYPFIVAKPTANAFAVERGGLQLYGLEVGLVSTAFEISLFVFSRTSLFTEIGKAGAEAAPDLPEGSQLAFWMADELRQDKPKGAQPVGLAFVPRDPQRERAVHLLTQLMLRFVWLHELYHGLNGHTGLLASRSPGAVLNEMAYEAEIGLIEVEPKGATKHRKGFRHAMEYDADRSALWMLVRLQQIDLEPIADWPPCPSR